MVADILLPFFGAKDSSGQRDQAVEPVAKREAEGAARIGVGTPKKI